MTDEIDIETDALSITKSPTKIEVCNEKHQCVRAEKQPRGGWTIMSEEKVPYNCQISFLPTTKKGKVSKQKIVAKLKKCVRNIGASELL